MPPLVACVDGGTHEYRTGQSACPLADPSVTRSDRPELVEQRTLTCVHACPQRPDFVVVVTGRRAPRTAWVIFTPGGP